MLMAHLSRDVAFIARTASVVVLADFVFTATAVAAQPVTGFLLLHATGLELSEGWIAASIGLYVLAGAFWLPVIVVQMRMRDVAAEAVAARQPLPERYHRLFRIWFLRGFPGFGSVMAIVWLMIARPSLGGM